MLLENKRLFNRSVNLRFLSTTREFLSEDLRHLPLINQARCSVRGLTSNLHYPRESLLVGIITVIDEGHPCARFELERYRYFSEV